MKSSLWQMSWPTNPSGEGVRGWCGSRSFSHNTPGGSVSFALVLDAATATAAACQHGHSCSHIPHPLHSILINNAGRFLDEEFRLTPEGIEQTLAVDFYAHVLLTLRLLDTLRRNGPARIINVARSVWAEGVAGGGKGFEAESLMAAQCSCIQAFAAACRLS